MVSAFKNQNYSKAITLARPLFEKKQDSTAARILAYAYLYQENTDSSLFFFRNMEESNVPVNNNMLAKTLQISGSYEEASIYYEKAGNEAGKLYCSLAKNQNLQCIPKATEQTVCYEFDATESIDPDRNDLIFQWEMGDGTSVSGAKVEHCYTTSGSYDVVFSVYDPVADKVEIPSENNLGMPNPYTINIPKDLGIDLTGGGKVGKSTTFQLDGEGKAGMQYLWEMGDGTIYSGEQVDHIYNTPGSYGIKVYEITTSGEVGSCSKKGIEVTGNGLWWAD